MKNYYLLFVLSVLCLGLFVRAETLYRRVVIAPPPVPGQTNTALATTNYIPVSAVVVNTNPPKPVIIGIIVPFGATPAISWTSTNGTNIHVRWHAQYSTNLKTWTDITNWVNGQSGFVVTDFFSAGSIRLNRLICNTNGL